MALEGFGHGTGGVGQRRMRTRPAPPFGHPQAISQ